jgi:hypothetical protein
MTASGRNQPLRFAEFHPIERPLLVKADIGVIHFEIGSPNRRNSWD